MSSQNKWYRYIQFKSWSGIETLNIKHISVFMNLYSTKYFNSVSTFCHVASSQIIEGHHYIILKYADSKQNLNWDFHVDSQEYPFRYQIY